MQSSTSMSINAQHFTLLSQRAVFWQQKRMLIIADPHFGKAAAFRRSGIAVPQGSTADDLKRLDETMAQVKPRTLMILGDLMHSTAMDTNGLRLVEQWRNAHRRTDCILVRGNHDRWSESPPAEFKINTITERISIPPFEFIHNPLTRSSSYVLGGHVHPAVVLTGPGRLKERLPCFYFGQTYGILPSFGSFTGYSEIQPREGDKLFVIADSRIISL